MTDDDDMTALGADDERLLADLADALGDDPLPDGLRDRAKQLITWMDVDAELAQLLEDEALADVRGDAVTPLLFGTADGEWTVEVLAGDVSGSCSGYLTGADAAVVQFVAVDGTFIDAQVGEFGEFHATALPAGPLRLRWQHAGATVVTDWFVLHGG